jgi:glycyl-tRNA synthetase
MKKKEENAVMENLIALCKRRGFIFQGSEIYGGLAGTWDFGPYGQRLKWNIEELWYKRFVTSREDMYPIDAAILMNPRTWEASGHVSGFSDPLVECNNCKKRYRVDSIIDADDYKRSLEDIKKPDFREDYKKAVLDRREELQEKSDDDVIHNIVEIDKKYKENLEKFIGRSTQIYLNSRVNCPTCNKKDWGIPRQFNMMFKTHVGAMEHEGSVSYLRPETAQGMFVNFKNIIDTFHPKLPFGMAQIGKAFRNEIAPRDFLFRSREFVQMEIEYFVDPKDEKSVNETIDGFYNEQVEFLTKDLGLEKERIHKVEVPASDRAHYSKRSIDTEFDFPFGQKELLGLAYRTDHDLKAHTEMSGTDLSYFDEEAKARFIPHCIEPTFGLDRLILAILSQGYKEDELGGEKRVYLKLAPSVAPVKVAVFPLLKNKDALIAKAKELYSVLKKELGSVEYDESGSIGKRYRRQDEIGTPFCVTVDFDTIEKDGNPVTVRDRDSGNQERIPLKDLVSYLAQKLGK